MSRLKRGELWCECRPDPEGKFTLCVQAKPWYEHRSKPGVGAGPACGVKSLCGEHSQLGELNDDVLRVLLHGDFVHRLVRACACGGMNTCSSRQRVCEVTSVPHMLQCYQGVICQSHLTRQGERSDSEFGDSGDFSCTFYMLYPGPGTPLS